MQEKMDTLYVIRNKGYHYPLLQFLTGNNPLKDEFVGASFVFCPNDPSENEIVKSDDELYNTNGYLRDKYVGRTHFLH